MYYKYKDQTKWVRIAYHKFWADPQLKTDKALELLEVKYESASPKQVAQRKKFVELGQLHMLRCVLYAYWKKYNPDELIAIAKTIQIVNNRIKELNNHEPLPR